MYSTWMLITAMRYLLAAFKEYHKKNRMYTLTVLCLASIQKDKLKENI